MTLFQLLPRVCEGDDEGSGRIGHHVLDMPAKTRPDHLISWQERQNCN